MQNVSKVLKMYMWRIHFMEKVQMIRYNNAEDLAGKKYQDKEIFNILRSPNGELKTVTS